MLSIIIFIIGYFIIGFILGASATDGTGKLDFSIFIFVMWLWPVALIIFAMCIPFIAIGELHTGLFKLARKLNL